MPCYEPKAEDYTRVKLESEVHKLTKMLCEVLGYLDSGKFDMTKLTKRTNDWWKQHQKFDDERRIKEL